MSEMGGGGSGDRHGNHPTWIRFLWVGFVLAAGGQVPLLLQASDMTGRAVTAGAVVFNLLAAALFWRAYRP